MAVNDNKTFFYANYTLLVLLSVFVLGIEIASRGISQEHQIFVIIYYFAITLLTQIVSLLLPFKDSTKRQCFPPSKLAYLYGFLSFVWFLVLYIDLHFDGYKTLGFIGWLWLLIMASSFEMIYLIRIAVPKFIAGKMQFFAIAACYGLHLLGLFFINRFFPYWPL